MQFSIIVSNEHNKEKEIEENEREWFENKLGQSYEAYFESFEIDISRMAEEH